MRSSPFRQASMGRIDWPVENENDSTCGSDTFFTIGSQRSNRSRYVGVCCGFHACFCDKYNSFRPGYKLILESQRPDSASSWENGMQVSLVSAEASSSFFILSLLNSFYYSRCVSWENGRLHCFFFPHVFGLNFAKRLLNRIFFFVQM